MAAMAALIMNLLVLLIQSLMNWSLLFLPPSVDAATTSPLLIKIFNEKKN